MASRFEVYKDRATGEAYETKAAAKKGCESVLRAATGAPIEEVET